MKQAPLNVCRKLTLKAHTRSHNTKETVAALWQSNSKALKEWE